MGTFGCHRLIFTALFGAAGAQLLASIPM